MTEKMEGEYERTRRNLSARKLQKQANIVPGGRQIIKSLLDNQVGISMNQNGGAYR